MPTEFYCRNVGESPYDRDERFVFDAFDATLLRLVALGSSGQWGTRPFSVEEGRVRDIRNLMEKVKSEPLSYKMWIAEATPTDEAGMSVPDDAECRVDDEGRKHVLAGMVLVRCNGYVATYVMKFFETRQMPEELAAAIEKQDFLWLEVLITDPRAGPYRPGAGAELIRRAKDFAKSLGKRYLWLDCWAGNDGKLVGYYQSQGFVPLFGCEVERHGKEDWVGKVLRMDLDIV